MSREGTPKGRTPDMEATEAWGGLWSSTGGRHGGGGAGRVGSWKIL